MNKENPQNSLEFLWNLIPKDAQNMIKKQYNGYKKATEMHEEEHFESFKAGIECEVEGGQNFENYYEQRFN